MIFVDELFKDAPPDSTVDRIRDIFSHLDIHIKEKNYESGILGCYSCVVSCGEGIPRANGKGVSQQFARASAYAELIERIQGGMFLFKFHSIHRNPEMDLHSFAPDGKYMASAELVASGDWMDHIIEAYPELGLTRARIVEYCKAFACADDDRILTLPFYSLFEKKYVYLPMAFVDQIYGSNGCCAGNTREEAWVHAFSEIMERHNSLKFLLNGGNAPKISEEILQQFPVVRNILSQIRASGRFVVECFDYSDGWDLPVVLTRLIDRERHNYRVNIGADPVLEIAVQRSLTELLQGTTLENVTVRQSGTILKSIHDISLYSNFWNQLETGEGTYAAEFFTEDDRAASLPRSFTDHREKNNKQLLQYMLDLYRKIGKPVYVRNFSFLGFPSYRFVVPGFSEALAIQMASDLPEYAVADQVSSILRNIINSTDDDLAFFLQFDNLIKERKGAYNNFGRLAGIPISGEQNFFLITLARAYASYRVKNYKKAISYLSSYLKYCNDDSQKQYFECVNRYLQLKTQKIDEDKIRTIIYKFFSDRVADILYQCLEQGKTPFDEYMISCNWNNCGSCRCQDSCSYRGIQQLNKVVACEYSKFTKGQAPSEFAIE